MRTRRFIAFILLATAALFIGLCVGHRSYGIQLFNSPLANQAYLPLAYAPIRPTPTPTPIPPLQGAGATYGNCQNAATADISWFYDWSPDPPVCPGVESIPMVYAWEGTFAPTDLGGNSDWLLGPNEPELPGQAGLTYAQAVDVHLWMESTGRRLTTPAVLSIDWLNNWYDTFYSIHGRTPVVDAVAVHCYYSCLQAPDSRCVDWSIDHCVNLTADAVAWASARSIPEVWVTEYAFPPWFSAGIPQDYRDGFPPDFYDGAIQYLTAITAHFRSEPTITRWAWFQLDSAYEWFGIFGDTSLVDDNGQLTLVGDAYVGMLP